MHLLKSVESYQTPEGEEVASRSEAIATRLEAIATKLLVARSY